MHGRVTSGTGSVSAGALERACRTHASLVYRLQENRLELRRQRRSPFEQRRPAYPGTQARTPSNVPLPLFRSVTGPTGFPRLAAAARIQGGREEPAFDCTTEKLAPLRNHGPQPVLLRARGEVDAFTAPMLRRCLEDAARGAGTVVLDLSSLSYLDASGIHVIEDFHGAHGGRLIVIGSRPNIQKILGIVRLDEIVPVVHTLEQALERLRRA